MGRLRNIGNFLAHAWNAFSDTQNVDRYAQSGGGYSGLSGRPDRSRMRISNERSLISSIYTRLSVDAASSSILHVKTDDRGRYLSTIKSGLNNCLTVEANLDQGASMFRQHIFSSLFDRGAIAIIPVDVDVDPEQTTGFDIRTMRVGDILDWKAKTVVVEVYNENSGKREELEVPKRVAAVVENPFYAVMNEPNSTLQRLIRKLNILDAVDEAAGSGKLDLIIQLPYVVKSDIKREQAEQRRADIEMQLKGSKYGIAYTDGAEKITQLNRPAENNMLKQIQYLTEMVYAQLGMSKPIFDGTADEATMLNYHNRTIEPVLRAVTEALTRTFLSKTARTQGQSIMAFRDPFKFVSLKDFADLADKLSRNEILSSNELRQGIGVAPSDDPKADQLINSNMPQAVEPEAEPRAIEQ